MKHSPPGECRSVVGDKQHLKYLWGGVETNKASKKQIEEPTKGGCLAWVVAYRTWQPSTKGEFVPRLSKGEEAMKSGQLQKQNETASKSGKA
jgi:hypothetical protein